VAEARGRTDEQETGLVDRVKARIAAERRKRAATRGPGGRGLLYALTASAIVLVIVFASSLVVLFSAPDGKQVSLTQLSALAAGGRVESATFLDEDSQVVAKVRSTADATAARAADKKAAATSVTVAGVPDEALTVRTAYPNNGATTNSTIQLLQASGAKVSVDPQAGQARLRAFTTFLLPVLILVNLFGILFVGKGGGGGAIGEVTNFGRVDDGSRTDGSNVTFADVGGAEEAVTELAEVRDYLKDPAKYKALGAAPP
jgi:cell division protease FtsH